MKPISDFLENYRNKRAEINFYGGSGDKYNGMFNIPMPNGEMAAVIVSNGGGWDHVSVSLKGRCPRWQEMCYIKDLFFADDEYAIQYHPKKADYVNIHDHCLHLWRPQCFNVPTPPTEFV